MADKSENKLFIIHLFTALGAPLALLALIAGAQGDLAMMFLWLAISLFVDGVDGPLARRFQIQTRLPRWSGAILDLVIDYATYVFLPAFALYQSGLLSNFWALASGSIIVFSGAIYFADTDMKVETGHFSGFPGVWNMVIVALIAIQASPWLILTLVALCTVLTFLPVHFVHPVRTVQWRPLTLLVFALWTFAIAYSVLLNFQVGETLTVVITVSSLYLFLVGAVQQLIAKLA
ncbi:phosphatidylcholine synthase [Pseudovibrio exalbescens]|uniref:CDP-alcohol phosphatidyltransferase family protein n=1 Tax=Pseudovibrio exalbescens TaxID=197461 RepID=UPI00236580C4|nr:CDP-alcohol phosphatidyltransferase family protein [Pseudovibrio exalbescens]MDD7908795.1 phosphatidylcholine synthase [Pseudovibrio exalbescens]